MRTLAGSEDASCWIPRTGQPLLTKGRAREGWSDYSSDWDRHKWHCCALATGSFHLKTENHTTLNPKHLNPSSRRGLRRIRLLDAGQHEAEKAIISQEMRVEGLGVAGVRV